MLADRIAVESGQTIAVVRHVAGDGDLVGDGGIGAGRGDPRARAGDLPHMDTFADRALRGFRPPGRGAVAGLDCHCRFLP